MEAVNDDCTCVGPLQNDITHKNRLHQDAVLWGKCNENEFKKTLTFEEEFVYKIFSQRLGITCILFRFHWVF